MWTENNDRARPGAPSLFAGQTIVLLTAIAGYVRLDEWSKGYYTGALRVAALAVVLASAAGMWFFVRR